MDIRQKAKDIMQGIKSTPAKVKGWIHHIRNLTPEEKKALRQKTARISLLYFAGFTVFLFVSFMILVLLTKSDKDVVVPDVTGKQFSEVYNSLVRKGLKPVITFEDMMDMDDGIILSQHPESGSVVSEGNKIKLDISRSKFRLPVPNLTGMELPIAINKLKNLHVQGRTISIIPGVISYINSEKTPVNIVIDQTPKAEEIIAPDRKINLLVSSGTAAAEKNMPSVAGQSINLAYDLLASQGLTIEMTIVDTTEPSISGQITSQEPAPGTPVSAGATAKISILYCPLTSHPYYAFEKFQFTIPEDEPEALYEAMIQDASPRRIVYSKRLKPEEKMVFVFHRSGNAKITILQNKKELEVESIDVE